MFHLHDFYITTADPNCTHAKYYMGGQIRENEEGGPCGTYGGEEMNTGFWWENLKKSGHLEDLDTDESIILKQILNTWDGSAHDMDKRWWALVNIVINFCVP